MLLISGLANDPENKSRLGDGNWKKVTLRDLSTSSTFWNRAIILSISKSFAPEATAALVYLLQKEAKYLMLWEKEWGPAIPELADFIGAISAWGRFSNHAGEVINVDGFWEKYTVTIEGLLAEPSFEFSQDEKIQAYSDILVKEDIQQVICFDDQWNEQNFLVETNKDWILFSWMTMA